jgi:hypothetical protein
MHTKINLKDLGQDMKVIFIASDGEILNTDHNAKAFIGKFVDPNKLNVGDSIRIGAIGTKYTKYEGLIIEKITRDDI